MAREAETEFYIRYFNRDFVQVPRWKYLEEQKKSGHFMGDGVALPSFADPDREVYGMTR